MITVILLSWDRLGQVYDIASKFLGMGDLVDQIIVWNNNPQAFPYHRDGLTIINSTEDMGLWTRFAAASLAKNEAIIYHDDDLEPKRENIEFLYRKHQEAPDVIHGTFGRRPTSQFEYSAINAYGACDVVLTRCLITPRAYPTKALQYVPHFDALQAAEKAFPRGNGEDIMLSYLAMRESGKQNWAYDLKVQEISTSDPKSIHVRFPGHMAYRTKLMRSCWELFENEERLKQLERVKR